MCRGRRVKGKEEQESLVHTSDRPKLNVAFCPSARVMAGTRGSLVSPSKATLDPRESCNSSPLREKAMRPVSRSSRQPRTSPALHLWPKLSLPLCHRQAWGAEVRVLTRVVFGGSLVGDPASHTLFHTV